MRGECAMKILNIPISDIEFDKFGFKSNTLTFSELIDIIHRELLKANLKKTVELAEKYDLSKMSMEEISKEVKNVRNNAKSNT